MPNTRSTPRSLRTRTGARPFCHTWRSRFGLCSSRCVHGVSALEWRDGTDDARGEAGLGFACARACGMHLRVKMMVGFAWLRHRAYRAAGHGPGWAGWCLFPCCCCVATWRTPQAWEYEFGPSARLGAFAEREFPALLVFWAYDDDESNINPPTPCQIGKRPPAPNWCSGLTSRTICIFPAAQKHEGRFFLTKVPSHKRARFFWAYRRPRGIYAGITSK